MGVVAALSVSTSVSAQWPQWRGPSRDGTVAAAATPKWPAVPQGWKRAWRVDVGEGYSSPVVSGGRVFVHSRRDPEERSAAKYEEERRYTVAESATWAVPALLPDGLIIRDALGIMRLTP